ncbi:hypothetical protein D0Z00_004093 [Geotrichum galactomycetum]|uniref:Uncharacterized protein n=1 Tax=Geotrichum galactomycetum TaxID=27317 RepID=A0ACB6UZH1_9ASCO|nr:hypothetical protein D0Z00_004093 [Geotrichum candidum]
MTLETYTATSKHAANSSDIRGSSINPATTSSLRRLAVLFTILVVVCSVFASSCLFPSSISTLIRQQKHLFIKQGLHSEPGTDESKYVIILDAGSIGSRIHVYQFKSGQAGSAEETPMLLSETFEMTRPGLSHYADDPVKAAASIDPLLQIALEKVPTHLHTQTPVSLKATAGLRLLGKDKAQRILDQVQKHITTNFPFRLPDANAVSILDGKDEAIYAWVTANYLLGNLNAQDPSRSTAAIFDLGGASTQIVFQPTNANRLKGIEWEHGDHRYDLSFANLSYTLYQHSHLGYGLMEARKKVHNLVYQKNLEKNRHAENGINIINPCLAPGLSRKITVTAPSSSNSIDVFMVGPDIAQPEECLQLTSEILNIDEHCTVEPCSFNGIHQPSISESIENTEFYIFSFFYDRTSPLGLPRTFSLHKLRDVVLSVCAGPSRWSQAFRDTASDFESLYDELYGRPEWCLDLSFMLSMLHDGYKIPMDRNVTIEKKVNGHELGWCLGASLPLLHHTSEPLE